MSLEKIKSKLEDMGIGLHAIVSFSVTIVVTYMIVNWFKRLRFDFLCWLYYKKNGCVIFYQNASIDRAEIQEKKRGRKPS